MTNGHLSYEMGFWNVEGSDAYAVISVKLTVTIKGQPIVRTGALAYTFARRDGVGRLRRRLGAVRRKPLGRLDPPDRPDQPRSRVRDRHPIAAAQAIGDPAIEEGDPMAPVPRRVLDQATN